MCSCGEPVDLINGESYLYHRSTGEYKKLGEKGYCAQCGRGYCKNHYGTTIHISDSRLFLTPLEKGSVNFCLECTDLYDDFLEQDYQDTERYAESYKNWMWPFGTIFQKYINFWNWKPMYRGSRAKN